jgi:hypothetical protein
MTYTGIDYGRGLTNRDHLTGIRFGVLPVNDVCQAWCDSSEAVYGNEPGDQEAGDHDEPIGWRYAKDGYECEAGDSGDIFITKSPYYTYAAFCSPCAPGACHLRNALEPGLGMNNNRAYCLGHDWFDESRAPYRVFRVEDNAEVFAEGDTL